MSSSTAPPSGAALTEKDPLLPSASRKPNDRNASRISPIVEPHETVILDLLSQLSRDAWLLIGSKAIRMFSYGFLAVILVIYLETLHFSEDSIGLMFTLTLMGDAIISIVLTSHADRWGRRFTLIIGSVLAISTSLIFATRSAFSVLLVTAIVGVISPSGSEIGPFMAIELSALAEVSSNSQRTALMAWYNLFGSLASAFGALTCGTVVDFLIGPKCGYSLRQAGSLMMLIYGIVQIGQLMCFLQLSNRIEVPPKTPPSTPAARGHADTTSSFFGLHRSKWVVLRLSALFMLDSFAGSFVLQSFVSAWFFSRYSTPSTTLGSIVFYCNIAAGVSALFAVQIANYIGLVMTMVVTHLPSNILLILVPVMPTQMGAILMICARYSISQMDVPTRNAYVQGVVEPDERSAANGVTNVVRSVGACLGPAIAGMLLANPSTASYPFFIAGGLKVVYDLLLLWNFSSLPSSSDVVFNSKSSKTPTPAPSGKEDSQGLELA